MASRKDTAFDGRWYYQDRHTCSIIMALQLKQLQITPPGQIRPLPDAIDVHACRCLTMEFQQTLANHTCGHLLAAVMYCM